MAGISIAWMAVDPLSPKPSRRAGVTPVLMTGFIRHLQALGYSRQTVIDLIAGLRCTMRILALEVDTRWIWRPNGTTARLSHLEPSKNI
jgi:hypothetical protein